MTIFITKFQNVVRLPDRKRKEKYKTQRNDTLKLE